MYLRVLHINGIYLVLWYMCVCLYVYDIQYRLNFFGDHWRVNLTQNKEDKFCLELGTVNKNISNWSYCPTMKNMQL